MNIRKLSSILCISVSSRLSEIVKHGSQYITLNISVSSPMNDDIEVSCEVCSMVAEKSSDTYFALTIIAGGTSTQALASTVYSSIFISITAVPLLHISTVLYFAIDSICSGKVQSNTT